MSLWPKEASDWGLIIADDILRESVQLGKMAIS